MISGMHRRLVLLLLPAAAWSANLIDNGTPGGNWAKWSPRAEISPEFRISESPDGKTLQIRSSGFEQYGKWVSTVPGIRPKQFYRFQVEYRVREIPSEQTSVAAMLSWFDGEGAKHAVQRDYMDRAGAAGEWRRFARTIEAPAQATSVNIELLLRWARSGSVEFRAASLEPVDAPPPRKVKIATTHFRPKQPATIDSNLKLLTSLIESAAKQKADIVCLPETAAELVSDLTPMQKADAIPNKVTRALTESARANRIWVVTSVVERDGNGLYNTAILINREGAIAGRYRKSHLPLAEAEDGFTPGSDYPVFDTEFGRVGMLICWDNWFVEPMRILRLKGAEMVFLPLAGETEEHWDVISRARAIDNGLYIISSITHVGGSRVVNPAGQVVAEAAGDYNMAVADVDLGQEWRTRWLSIGPGQGEGKSLYRNERRPDIYSELHDNSGSGADKR